jgi:hypothetical protein
MTKKQLKTICSSDELSRQDARVLMRHLFQDSFSHLSNKTNIHAFYLREMICYIKPFSITAQTAIIKASLEILNQKTKKTKAS